MVISGLTLPQSGTVAFLDELTISFTDKKNCPGGRGKYDCYMVVNGIREMVADYLFLQIWYIKETTGRTG